MDDNTQKHCYPHLSSLLPEHLNFTIPSGEDHKNLKTCESLWQKLMDHRFDRKSILINLGGGVVGDLGGFVAGTYKRGMRFIQVPTTLLSQVDASVGSKTGIDFHGFKNQLGMFADPLGVCLFPDFLNTLDKRQLRSGFAEMIKHCLIKDKDTWKKMISMNNIPSDIGLWVADSVNVKVEIVQQDPFEQNIRKALNFGHTFGHALESYFLFHESCLPLLHGEAVAAGMICESYLSYKTGLLSSQELDEIRTYILSIFGTVDLDTLELDTFYEFMKQDKKNLNSKIKATFLNGIGDVSINHSISIEEVRNALSYYESGK